MSLDIDQVALSMVLSKLQYCEVLELSLSSPLESFISVGSNLSALPNLRGLVLGNISNIGGRNQTAILDMIKSSNSIGKAHVQNSTMPSTFQDQLGSFCILNRVFGTNLIGSGPTDAWTRVISKIRDASAKATLLYRLLGEKPELIVGITVSHQTRTRSEEPLVA